MMPSFAIIIVCDFDFCAVGGCEEMSHVTKHVTTAVKQLEAGSEVVSSR
jgi:hypothetical protein